MINADSVESSTNAVLDLDEKRTINAYALLRCEMLNVRFSE